MTPSLAIQMIGSPFDSELQVSDIGLLVIVILFLMRFYQRVDKFEDVVAKRLDAKIQAAAAPKMVELLPNPLTVKPHVDFTPLQVHEAMHGGLRAEVAEIRTRIDANFKELRDERSRSTGNLHERIESMDGRAAERTEELRKEIKEDIRGVHNRMNDILSAVSNLQGRII
jgi:uncharacterized protein YdhG (YjbR/CyaY superfamily)